ncbi:transporter substrate-binding domain-containing protein [Aestuariirhabdus sp. Z084]|uniref:substrate-binding periplasmic protein n=1 Tax=Aestuariirhabdus haliotis TaxID=2918751 RepID=UPI00201B3EC4|nr:transporter substrate-binding domain-containing protein [Aestuariirhabdus haliotis]MCL6417054.1 transporter substrate-binding domain-containing protein [Aestuariirhabdus haliotis]MCL6420965.1 transporter substrate-binding domain-containing protein [Aestuariirhabdus haliotis]
MTAFRYIAIALVGLCQWASAASSDVELIFAYGAFDGPPHALLNPKPPRQLTGGVMYDLGLEIGKRLNTRVRFIKAPRARLVDWLIKGKVHAQCELNPAWIQDDDELFWSSNLFDSVDRFYSTPETAKRIKEHSDLKGLRVGGLKDYSYSPRLTHLVMTGEVMRVDAASAQQLFQMLERKRIEVVIVDEIVGNYLSSLFPGRFVQTQLEDAHEGRYCAFSKNAPVLFEQFNAAVQSLIDDGTIRDILRKYL